MRIAFIDYEHHRKVPAQPTTLQSDVPFVLGAPETGKTLADLTAQDHLIIVASDEIFWFNPQHFACKVSVILAEPAEVHGRFHLYLRLRGQKFHRILTQYTSLLKACPNARFLAFGTTWITEKSRDFSTKTKHMSLIASRKKSASGHRLRHRIVKTIRANNLDVDVMGRGYEPFAKKESALADYHFSVVIENTRSAGYFSEKLMDCMICQTLPIYWGAPDIAHFFDPLGMIICQTQAELINAITKVSTADYHKREPYMLENRRRALTYDNYYQRAATLLDEDSQFSL